MLGQQAFGFGSNGDITGGTVNAASNGLSLSGATTVVLGQDVGAVGNPAALTSDREIPSSNFSLTFLNVDVYTKIFSTIIKVKADLPIIQLLDDTESLSLQLERRDTDGRIVYGSSADSNLFFFDTGNAKVGNSNTTDLGQKLQVVGDIALQNEISNDPVIKFVGSSSASDMFIQGQDGTIAMFHDSSVATMQINAGGGVTIADTTTAIVGDKTLFSLEMADTFDTTGVQRTAFAAQVSNSSSRIAGANNLINYGLFVDVVNGQINYAAIFNNGLVGVNTIPTAKLHIGAGSATANTAPLKFTSGTLLSSAEAGAMEFLTDNAYITITTGAARKEFTLNDITLTSTRVPIATTNGRLTDLSTFTYGSGRLSPNYITLAAGAAGANTAPLKFTSGTNNTTAEPGAMEYNGTNLFFTRTGTTRENIICASAVTTEVIVSDTSLTINFGGTTYKLLARA
jgi:hypothetical protein